MLSAVEALGSAAAKPPRLYVIGLDGATWDVMRPMMYEGKLPHLKALVERGSDGILHLNVRPGFSPNIWTTIVTGVTPERHGIDYMTFRETPFSSRDRRADALWNILSSRRRHVAVVGYMVTWPVESVAGTMISDQLLTPGVHSTVFPPDALEGYPGPLRAWEPEDRRPVRRFMPPGVDLGLYPEAEVLIGSRLSWSYMHDESFTRIAEHLLAKTAPDFFAIHLWGVDSVSHGFWKYRGTASPLARVIGDYYTYADELVGRLVRLAGPDTSILVLSDHGFEADPDVDPASDASGRHHDDGILIAAGPLFKKDFELRADAGSLDVMPTLLQVYGLPAADDMPGRVLTELFQAPQSVPERIATYGPGPYPGSIDEASGERLGPEELRMLKALGYLK